jgi:hypothetical protein
VEVSYLESSKRSRDERLINYRASKSELTKREGLDSAADAAAATESVQIDEDEAEDEGDTVVAASEPATATGRTETKKSSKKKQNKKKKQQQKQNNAKLPYAVNVLDSVNIVQQWNIEHHSSINAIAAPIVSGPRTMFAHLELLAAPVFVADTTPEISIYRNAP